uniref:Uncharacterized protein n=1 Tax=Rhizophora mucronata TaxID=61149 RepID=A0A2P2M3X1_RHIMU
MPRSNWSTPRQKPRVPSNLLLWDIFHRV